MKKQRDPTLIYAVIFWTSLAVIAVWIVLKAIGIIDSPTWQELIPFASAIFGAGAFFQMVFSMNRRLGKVEGKVEHTDKDIGYLRIDVEVLKKDFEFLKSGMGLVKNKLRL